MRSRKTIFARYSDLDFSSKTRLTGAVSLLATLSFAIYHGYLGLQGVSLWNGCICLYYLMLVLLRWVILAGERKIPPHRAKGLFTAVHILLFLTDLSLITPVALMVLMRRPIRMGTIAAIACAAYTTYKTAFAIWNLKKAHRQEDLLTRALRYIGMTDALVSILVLQNTLIAVNADDGGASMQTFTAVTSPVFLILILALPILSYRGGTADKHPA